MMTKKKILIAGCSLASSPLYSGFHEENHFKYHWNQLLTKHYDVDCHNIAIGGMSNHEIFVRSIENCLTDQYNLTVIMWSSIGRLWLYQNKNNVDDWTGFHPENIFGLNPADNSAKLLHKVYYSSFHNSYIELKHWLLQTISLASFFKSRNQPYIFVKGFDNFINDFSIVEYHNSFVNCTKSLSDMLDFTNRPDEFILSKVNHIKNLIDEHKKLNWVNLSTKSFIDLIEDVADDSKHPGPITNKKMCSQIIHYIDAQRLL